MKILSLGDLLLDLLVRYDPASGEVDVGAGAVQMHPGGSAANFAVQAARLGGEVRFVSRVGRDMPGEMLVRSLESEGVVPEVRVVAEEATGRVLVMLDPAGNRRMWSYPGASAGISPGDLDPGWFRGLDAFHLTGYSFMREGPREAAFEALRLARALGSPLCTLDPNPPHLIADYGPARFRDLMRELRFDAIFPNMEEGSLLSGEGEPGAVVSSLLEISPLVVLKLGAEGCLVGAGDSRITVPGAQLEEVVDVTGAGDAFAAAFVVEYLAHRDAPTAAAAANSFAARVVGRAGAR
ncbi:MAG: PfkB family carbohydrate kinase [Chloroflexota bacterium]|nr:PfkB family carbohydrate kinase [Chloroflexota bacterium]